MKIHYIKSNPKPFTDAWLGVKKYEVRDFDREYAVMDRVYMLEFVTEGTATEVGYTGRLVWCEITHLTKPGEWGLPKDRCVFGFELIDRRIITPRHAQALRDGCPVHMRFQVGCPHCEREGK